MSKFKVVASWMDWQLGSNGRIVGKARVRKTRGMISYRMPAVGSFKAACCFFLRLSMYPRQNYTGIQRSLSDPGNRFSPARVG